MPHPSNRSALDLFIRRLCSHSRLSEEEREAILRLPSTLAEVGAHRDFVRLGEVVDHACLVVKGLVGRFGQMEDGKRQFVAVHIPGEMADLPSLAIPQSATALNALTSTSLLRVPNKALRDLSFRYPAVSTAFWRDCVLNGGIVAQWLINVGRRDARTRIAHLLCELAVRYRLLDQSNGRSFELPMTQEQMADALALTSVHINRMLQNLRAEGVLTITRSRVDILDWDTLAAAAEFDSSYLEPGLPSYLEPGLPVAA